MVPKVADRVFSPRSDAERGLGWEYLSNSISALAGRLDAADADRVCGWPGEVPVKGLTTALKGTDIIVGVRALLAVVRRLRMVEFRALARTLAGGWRRWTTWLASKYWSWLWRAWLEARTPTTSWPS